MEFKKSMKSLAAECLLVGMLATAPFLSGCRAIMPNKADTEKNYTTEPQARVSVLYTQVKPNISEQTRTIKIPHAEKSIGTIGNYNIWSLSCGLGLAVEVREPVDLKLGAGIDGIVRFNPFSFEQVYKKEQPSLSPSEYAKMFSYSKFRQPGWFSYEPFIGADVSVGNLVLGLEYGLPYARFDLEQGYYREYEDYRFAEKSSWKGLGQSLTGRIGLKESDFLLGNLGLAYKHEWYEPKILNKREKINADSIFLTLEEKF